MPRLKMNSTAAKDRRENRILVGPAGWSYADWNGVLYPARRPRGFHETAFLAEYFDTIEINTSFYNPLRFEQAWQWVEQISANPDFVFTAKLWQKFTHKEDADAADERAVREGFDVLQEAGRLAAVLVQFPFSFHNTPENLVRLDKIASAFHDYPLVVEVRHSSWAVPEIDDFLRERQIGICNIDQPIIGRSIKPGERVTSKIGYFRFHGRREDTWFSDDPELPRHERYNYLYSDAELEPWVKRIQKVAERADKTFVIANNHYEAKGVVNALQLINLLSGEKVKVPDTLRNRYLQLDAIADAPAAEPTLFPMPPT